MPLSYALTEKRALGGCFLSYESNCKGNFLQIYYAPILLTKGCYRINSYRKPNPMFLPWKSFVTKEPLLWKTFIIIYCFFYIQVKFSNFLYSRKKVSTYYPSLVILVWKEQGSVLIYFWISDLLVRKLLLLLKKFIDNHYFHQHEALKHQSCGRTGPCWDFIFPWLWNI